MDFVCYAISLFDLGLAVAAAIGLAKLAAVGISLYIKMNKAIIVKSKETTCLGKCAKHCNIPYLSLTLLLLGIIDVASCVVVMIIKENHSNTAASELSDRVHFAYGILPLVLIPSLFIVMSNLREHCKREEYINCCEHMQPSSANDRDEEHCNGVRADKSEADAGKECPEIQALDPDGGNKYGATCI